MRFFLLLMLVSLSALASEGDSCSNSHFDCFPDSQYFCLNGKCVWKNGINRCHSDFDCVFPERCNDGVCARNLVEEDALPCEESPE